MTRRARCVIVAEMGRRRRQQVDEDGGVVGELLEALIGLARRSPRIGLGVAAAIFAVGALLFWGDPKQLNVFVRFAGIVPLLMGGIVRAVALIYLVRDGRAP